MSTATIAPVETEPITGQCDRCIAAAQVRVTLENGFDLQFCGHHAAKYSTGLATLGVRVEAKEF